MHFEMQVVNSMFVYSVVKLFALVQQDQKDIIRRQLKWGKS